MIANVVTNAKIVGSLPCPFLAAAVLVVRRWYPEVAATIEHCPAVVSTLLPASVRNELQSSLWECTESEESFHCFLPFGT